MKYAIDKDLKRYMVKMPFYGWFCKMTHKPMDIMLAMTKVPDDIEVRDFYITGYKNEPIRIKEIIPESPGDGAILVLHGGGFGYKTSPHQFLNACQYAKELHCRAYLPDYHLLPDYPFPAAYEDAMAAYRYMVTNAVQIGIQPEKIIVLGDSAGGALAANICNTAQENSLPMPCCQVLIYPLTDNEMKTESMKCFTDTPMWNAKNNKRMWEMYAKNLSDEELCRAVPLKNPKPDELPPTYIETAEFDCLHDEAVIYAENIREKAKTVELYETKGTAHGYDIASKHPAVMKSIEKRIAFMRKFI
jgi:acetyl esterase